MVNCTTIQTSDFHLITHHDHHDHHFHRRPHHHHYQISYLQEKCDFNGIIKYLFTRSHDKNLFVNRPRLKVETSWLAFQIRFSIYSTSRQSTSCEIFFEFMS